jgi:hypothetical protein
MPQMDNEFALRICEGEIKENIVTLAFGIKMNLLGITESY